MLSPPIRFVARLLSRRTLPMLLLLALAPDAAHAANLIANGSFETGPDPGVATSLAVGSTAVSGWVVTGAAIDYVGTEWSAAEGGRSIALNGSAPGGIAQTFATLPHAQYNVRFYMAGDPGTTPAIKWVRVRAAGQSADYSMDTTGMWPWDPGWDLRVFAFTADSTATTVEFTSLMSGDSGPAIDSVTAGVLSTAAVPPAPATLSLAIAGANPAPGGARIAFTLPRDGAARLRVLDLAGREIATLADGVFPAGRQERTWSTAAPAGVYFVELSAAGQRLTRRLVRLGQP